MSPFKSYSRWAATAVATAALATVGLAQQASLTLSNSNAAICYHNSATWDLTKVANPLSDPFDNTASFIVTATRGADTAAQFGVVGFVSVKNSGTAPATIGNIVVNLQKRRTVGNKLQWVSASANVATAFAGDAATQANIVASASAETVAWNSAWNVPATYAVSGAKGTFKENAASGSLNFTDANNNTVWAITPGQTIAPGATVPLLFTSQYDPTLLGIVPGEQVRAEVIVSFGGVGPRGGSGASAANIDVSGNGSVDPDEAYVRSVPTRITLTVPALETCNDEVTLTDLGLTTTGTVTYTGADFAGFDAGVVIDDTTSFLVTVDGVEGGLDGGELWNTATLVGQDEIIQLITGYDALLQPIYLDFLCCEGVDLSASAFVAIGGYTPPPGGWVTFSQGGFSNTGAPGLLFEANFAGAFPGGVTIGVGRTATWTSVAAVRAYLPEGGPSGAFTLPALMNPTSTSAGSFAAQLLTLKMNVGLSDFGATPGGFGDLYLNKPDQGVLHGMTVRQILAAMEVAIGGGGLPAGYSFGDLNTLATNLNTQAWHVGSTILPPVAGPWAIYLSVTPP